MQMLPKLLLMAAVIVFVVAIILSLIQTVFIVRPGAWLELSLVLTIFSIAFKYVLHSDKSPEI